MAHVDKPDYLVHEITKYAAPLRAFALSLSGNQALADDLVQETFLKACTARHENLVVLDVRAWLHTILRNTYISHLRRRRFEVEGIDVPDSLIAFGEPQEMRLKYRDLCRALYRLPPNLREVVLLVGGAGFTYQEAALICQCEVGTIRSRLSRARSRLACELSVTENRELA